MSQQLLDVSDLPQPFVQALEAAIQSYRAQIASPASPPKRVFGWAKDILPELPPSFFDPLPDDLLDLFEGKGE